MRALLRSFLWTAYDHLGGLLAYNALWSALNLPWLALAYGAWSAGLSLGGMGALAGALLAAELAFLSPAGLVLHLATAAWVRQREASCTQILRRARRLFARAQWLQVLVLLATALLLLNMQFYRSVAGWPGLLLCGLMVWLLLALVLLAAQLPPLLATQEQGVWQTLRLALLVVVGSPGAAAVALLGSLLLLAAGLGTGAGLFCGFAAASALFASAQYRLLLARYTGEGLPAEAPRRLRELIRPWEGG